MATTSTTPSTPSTDPRVAVVTGGSGGIGRVAAERLAADGMSVVVHYSGNAHRAEQAVQTITAAGGTATTFQADIADETEVSALFDHAEQAYGGVDVVVHTAGIMLLSPLVDADLADIDRMHRTNIRGTFVVDQQAARRVRPGGAIINFSTSVVKLAPPNYTGYAATKGAVDAMTLILAKELTGRDITVNAVSPGPTATPLFLDDKDDATLERTASMNPMGRLGTPEDIAETIAFLAGPGRWVNGNTCRTAAMAKAAGHPPVEAARERDRSVTPSPHCSTLKARQKLRSIDQWATDQVESPGWPSFRVPRASLRIGRSRCLPGIRLLPRPASGDLQFQGEAQNVRISTMIASTPTLVKVGATATVRMMSAATRNSSPRRIDRPIWRRYS